MALFEDLVVSKLTIGDTPLVDGSTIGTTTSGTLTASHKRMGFFYQTTFTLTNARVVVTDAAGSGSYGTLKLFTFPVGSINILGCRQNYTATAEGSALTTAAGDAAYVWGVGTVAVAAAADGALATTSVDIGASTATITNSGGTGAGTKHTGTAGTVIDGTSTAGTINLNWSGSAATIDATSYIDVTATITVLWAHMGDD